jgi:hypothetical protein
MAVACGATARGGDFQAPALCDKGPQGGEGRGGWDGERAGSPTRQRGPGSPSPAPVIVAPEVVARILADRIAGVPASAICARLHMTPGEVLGVLHAG